MKISTKFWIGSLHFFFICSAILERLLCIEAYLADVPMYCLYYLTLFNGLNDK